ncbi:MAG: carbohydrate kinase [Candidatus Acidiferrum sp.]
MKPFAIVGLGEVLWDLLPGGKQPGGAPANFAYMSSLLGDRGIIASRIGCDELGREIQQKLQALGLDLSYLQCDSARPTGTVKVEADSAGQPKYEITAGVAWDFLEWTPQWRELAEQADAVCFGSLAQRNAVTRETAGQFLRAMRKDAVRILDVNLRQCYFSAELLAQSAEHAQIVKLNHEEVPIVMKVLDAPYRDELMAAQWLRKRFGVKLVCITRGANGSLLACENGSDAHPGFPVNVADTVGAGDAFTAGLVHHYLRRSSLRAMNEAANRMGAWVASQPGATPVRDETQLEKARGAVGG